MHVKYEADFLLDKQDYNLAPGTRVNRVAGGTAFAVDAFQHTA